MANFKTSKKDSVSTHLKDPWDERYIFTYHLGDFFMDPMDRIHIPVLWITYGASGSDGWIETGCFCRIVLQLK